MLVTRRTRIPELFGQQEGDIDTMFRRLMNLPFVNMPAEPQPWRPAVELVDVGEELVLTAELPGIDPEKVDVTIEENVLTIRGEKEEKHEEKEPKYHVFERVYGTFERSFTLPPTVETEKIDAEFKNGVVTIHLPKTKKATGRKIKLALHK